MTHRSGLRLTLFALSALTCASAQAQVQYFGSVSTTASVNNLGTPVYDSDEDSLNAATPFGTLESFSGASATIPALGDAADGSGRSWVRAELGSVHLRAEASASVIAPTALASNINSSGDATAESLFSEVLVFGVPAAAAGTVFSVTARFRLDAARTGSGTLTGTSHPSFFNASSSWSTRVSMANGPQGYLFEDERGGQCTGLNDPVCIGDAPGWFTVTFDMMTQTNTLIQMSGLTRATAGVLVLGEGYGSAGAVGDLGHTLAWDGVLEVRDGDELIEDYSLMGLGSGFDFRQPVPEPAQQWLGLAGLAALAFARRRARHLRRDENHFARLPRGCQTGRRRSAALPIA